MSFLPKISTDKERLAGELFKGVVISSPQFAYRKETDKLLSLCSIPHEGKGEKKKLIEGVIHDPEWGHAFFVITDTHESTWKEPHYFSFRASKLVPPEKEEDKTSHRNYSYDPNAPEICFFIHHRGSWNPLTRELEEFTVHGEMEETVVYRWSTEEEEGP